MMMIAKISNFHNKEYSYVYSGWLASIENNGKKITIGFECFTNFKCVFVCVYGSIGLAECEWEDYCFSNLIFCIRFWYFAPKMSYLSLFFGWLHFFWTITIKRIDYGTMQWIFVFVLIMKKLKKKHHSFWFNQKISN